jgi:hypothetical protein
MLRHSPEPWRHESGYRSPSECWSAIYAANRELVIYDTCNEDELARIVEQHRRIVRGVNAGSDLSDERLDECIVFNAALAALDTGDTYGAITVPADSVEEFDPLVPLMLTEDAAVKMLEAIGYTLIPPLGRALEHTPC